MAFAAAFFELDLVTHGRDRARIGADKDDPCFRKRARKGFAFGQKSIAGMHGFGAGAAAGLDDLVDHQVAFGRGRRADEDRVVGHFDVKGVAVSLRIDGDRLNSHPAGGLDDAAGDLAAVSDQNSFEHVKDCLRSPIPTLARGGLCNHLSYSKTEPRQRLICWKPVIAVLHRAYQFDGGEPNGGKVRRNFSRP